MFRLILFIGFVFSYQTRIALATGTLTDSRDGQTYLTLTLRSQTWMAENLNYETNNSWCYNDSLINCKNHGRLYSWESALCACPDNWHLPGKKEWENLELFLGMTAEELKITQLRGEGTGTKFKNENAWESKNGNIHGYIITGFKALLSGIRLLNDGSYIEPGERASWWSSSHNLPRHRE